MCWPTVDFEYMIKNKEATDSAAVEFCSYFEQIADSPNFLRKLALKLCFRQKPLKLRHSSNWAANLFKIWQNSNAALSVASLFFIIYSKSTVGQLQLKTSLLHPSIYNLESHHLSLSESVLLDPST